MSTNAVFISALVSKIMLIISKAFVSNIKDSANVCGKVFRKKNYISGYSQNA